MLSILGKAWCREGETVDLCTSLVRKQKAKGNSVRFSRFIPSPSNPPLPSSKGPPHQKFPVFQNSTPSWELSIQTQESQGPIAHWYHGKNFASFICDYYSYYKQNTNKDKVSVTIFMGNWKEIWATRVSYSKFRPSFLSCQCTLSPSKVAFIFLILGFKIRLSLILCMVTHLKTSFVIVHGCRQNVWFYFQRFI